MRFLKLWMGIIPIVITLLLVLVLVLSLVAFARETDIDIPLLMSVRSGEDQPPAWEFSIVGAGLAVLVLPPLVAGAIALLTRNDSKEASR